MIYITTIGFNTTKTEEENIIEKVKKLEKYMKKDVDFRVGISLKNKKYKTSIMVKHAGVFLRSEDIDFDMMKSVNEAVSKMKRDIRKIKTKIESRRNLDKWEEVFNEGSDMEVSSDKTNTEHPLLTEKEAYEKLEELGYVFLVYKDRKTNDIKIMYLTGREDIKYKIKNI